ncbi:hypothetical protein TUBRATIS_20770 [Tubulinosema ratisbonensis]|uniref:Uncharacterized protein n=1 Tax=Tubulinosema ratisbonensis TaxID=291195 RepID=A0A437AJV7_9MICR|nr:hypothetical protein TUBRATIS_20770 [Tubulinosema ratisbonensis]
MLYSNNSYRYFSFLYALRFIAYIIYMKLLVSKLNRVGSKVSSISLYLALMFFLNTFLSFLAFSNVFISKKLKLFIPYIVIEGHMVLYSTALLPFLTRSYIFLSCIFPLMLAYFFVLYNYDNISKLDMAMETNKYNLSEIKQRGIKVSIILIR